MGRKLLTKIEVDANFVAPLPVAEHRTESIERRWDRVWQTPMLTARQTWPCCCTPSSNQKLWTNWSRSLDLPERFAG